MRSDFRRTCPSCCEAKELGEFFAAEGFAHGRMGECKACFNKRVSRSRPLDPVKERADVKAFIRSTKNRPCQDCGNRYPPEVMEYDHVPGRGEKLFALSNPPYLADVYMARREMAKCDLVCANCHRVRTTSRRGTRPKKTPLEVIKSAIERRPALVEMMVARRAQMREEGKLKVPKAPRGSPPKKP